MVKRRPRASDEIMLIPFLDILCSLIGVLILIIVVLTVAQMQKINGRTVEDVARSEAFQKLARQRDEDAKVNDLLRQKTDSLEKVKKDLADRQEQIVKLRKLLDPLTASPESADAMKQKMMKELDDILVQMGGLNTQEASLKKEVAALMEEIKKRQPPEQKGPPVVVKPGGSGLAKGSKVFFIEATAGKLTLYWDGQKKSVVSAVPEVIATDVSFNAFLKGVLAVPQSKIIFLLRDDGMGAYNNGAGWAQGTHGYRVDQIGKLPIPGRGEIDLKMFQEYLGAMTPPPEAKLVTPAQPAQSQPPPPPAKN